MGMGEQETGLTTKEWLSRIEDSLVRIEDKLDSKASVEAVVGLESRLRLMETLGSEQSRSAERDIRALTSQVASLKTKVYAILAVIGILAAVGEVIRQGVSL